MATATLSVLRSNPPVEPEISWQTYAVEMPDDSTVLEALMKIQDEQDGTLAFRRACRHAICGSCAMRINGCAKLACNTQLSLAAEQARQMATLPGRAAGETDGAVTVAPLGNMPVVKDLVTDMDVFWRKLRRTRPWLFPLTQSPDPDEESHVLPQEWERLAQGVLCLECGACYSDCCAVAAAPEYIGPAALVKANRYVTDVRDIDEHRRLLDLSDDHGLWECLRCYFCSERCPKHIRVRELIAQLGELAWREGLRRDPGARHAQAFVTSLQKSGRLDETSLAVRSQGLAWAAHRLPMAVRVALAGKLAPPPRPLEGHEALTRVMEAVAPHEGGEVRLSARIVPDAAPAAEDSA